MIRIHNNRQKQMIFEEFNFKGGEKVRVVRRGRE